MSDTATPRGRTRRLKIELMWIRPVLFLVIASVILFMSPPALNLISFALLLAGLGLGCLLGWQRGKLIKIEVHPETHEINQSPSKAALYVLMALIAFRFGARAAVMEIPLPSYLSINSLMDTIWVLWAGLVVTQGLEMWIRARRLLAEARAVKVAMP